MVRVRLPQENTWPTSSCSNSLTSSATTGTPLMFRLGLPYHSLCLAWMSHWAPGNHSFHLLIWVENSHQRTAHKQRQIQNWNWVPEVWPVKRKSLVCSCRSNRLNFRNWLSKLYICELCAWSLSLSCPALCDPMECSQSGSSVRGILQARILEWVAMPPPPGDLPNPRKCVFSHLRPWTLGAIADFGVKHMLA